MAKDLQHILESVGFDDKEAALYLAGLKFGSAPASHYAKETNLNRITAYNVLEDLVRRGYFTINRKLRAKWYAPIAPEYVSVEVRKSVDALDRVLPELKSLMQAKFRKPRVRFFEGWEGVKMVYEDTLTASTEILNFANSTLVRSYWPNYDEEYVAKRVKKKIYLRGIAPDDATGKRVHGLDKQNQREIRLVSSKEFHFNNEVKIYDNKVSIVSFGTGDNLFGVIIESKEVADTQRQIFEMAWRFAGKK